MNTNDQNLPITETVDENNIVPGSTVFVTADDMAHKDMQYAVDHSRRLDDETIRVVDESQVKGGAITEQTASPQGDSLPSVAKAEDVQAAKDEAEKELAALKNESDAELAANEKLNNQMQKTIEAVTAAKAQVQAEETDKQNAKDEATIAAEAEAEKKSKSKAKPAAKAKSANKTTTKKGASKATDYKD